MAAPLPPVCKPLCAVFILANALASAGCASIGPSSVPRDRFQYVDEVARSWKEQMLLNIVKSRYVDPPVFLDVSQIVSGYTIQGTVTAGTDSDNTAISGLSAGVSGVYTDRPTITYTPLTGAQFNREIMTPLPPSTVLFTMTSGWPVDLVPEEASAATTWPCWSTMETNQPVQFQPGMTAPCLRSRASAIASSRAAALPARSIPL